RKKHHAFRLEPALRRSAAHSLAGGPRPSGGDARGTGRNPGTRDRGRALGRSRRPGRAPPVRGGHPCHRPRRARDGGPCLNKIPPLHRLGKGRGRGGEEGRQREAAPTRTRRRQPWSVLLLLWRLTSTKAGWPLRMMRRATALSEPLVAERIAFTASEGEPTDLPPTPTITSPGWMPAWSAGEPGCTCATTAPLTSPGKSSCWRASGETGASATPSRARPSWWPVVLFATWFSLGCSATVAVTVCFLPSRRISSFA